MTSKRAVFWLGVAAGFLLFLFAIRSILLPFVLGIFIAYFLDPAADRLEKARLSRTLATLLLIIGFFLLLALLLVLIVPILASQLTGLVAALPDYTVAFEQKFEPQITAWLGGLPAETVDSIKSAIADTSGIIIGMAGGFVTNLFQSGMAFVQLLSLVLITPIVAFYLLRDWDDIMERLDDLLPRAQAATIREQSRIINLTLAGFIRGQLNVCILLGLYYAFGLTIIGLKFGIVIGLGTGFLVIFPYVGLLFGTFIGLSVAFFQFGFTNETLAVLAVFVTGQLVEGNFITPKLVGDKVGLHPVWIIFGMLAGGALFGFVGVLLAVPATAVTGVLIRFAIAHYRESSYYQGDKKPRKA